MNKNTIDHIEESIHLGYEWIGKIETEFPNYPNGVSAFLDHYYRLIKEWETQVSNGLSNAARKAEFMNAKSSSAAIDQLSTTPSDIQKLTNDIKEKIKVLSDYKKELQPSFINLGAQARLNINSIDKSTNIISDNFINIVNNLEQEFEMSYAGTDKEEVLALIEELKERQTSREKKNKILGTLLTKGSEVAQVASLVLQLLQMVN